MRKFSPLSILLLVGFLFVLPACMRSGPDIDPNLMEIFGPYSATGTIVSTGASLYRRGTHVLQMKGDNRFFLESTDINLNDYRGETVVVQGELEANTHPQFMPVLHVTQVRTLQETPLAAVKEIRIPALRLALDIPVDWEPSSDTTGMTFRLVDEEAPFLRIARTDLSALPDAFYIRLAGKDGARVIDETTGMHTVFLQDDTAILAFTFAPKGEASILQRDAFYSALRSLRFFASVNSSASSSNSSTTSGGDVTICGGPAGIVCPASMFCQILDLQSGIGECRTVGN